MKAEDVDPSSGPIIVLTTTNLEDEAVRMADMLIGRGMAACVSILPPMRSVYRWKNQIETENEYLMVIKSVAANYPLIEETIRESHSYEMPEILAIPAVFFEERYGGWLLENSQRYNQKT